MKKIFVFLILSFMLPLEIFAYSKFIIPGGETLGIELKSDGIMIIGFYAPHYWVVRLIPPEHQESGLTS